MQHQNEIEKTRVGGFGGSDARMFYKVGLKGLSALSNTDKKRIAVAKGLQPYKAIKKTAAMQKGHDFEDWVASYLFYRGWTKTFEREKKINRELAKNFKTFAHADFYFKDISLIWELKCVAEPDIDKVAETYKHQLQWYYMLGVKSVILIISDSSKDFREDYVGEKLIPRDENYIKILEHGIKLIDDAWDSFDREEDGDMEEADLMPWDKTTVVALTDYFREIKRLEAQADDLKAQILDFMEAQEINSIKSDYYTISYIGASEAATFDKKKLLAEHPEINESDYLKISKKKSFIKINLK